AYCLGILAEIDTRVGHWDTAYAGAFESIEIAREADQGNLVSYNLSRLAWLEAAQGREELCRAHAEEAIRLAASSGLISHAPFAESALGLPDPGIGRPAATADRLESAPHMLYRWGVLEVNRFDQASDLIEACFRTGELSRAQRGLERLERQVARTERPMS